MNNQRIKIDPLVDRLQAYRLKGLNEELSARRQELLDMGHQREARILEAYLNGEEDEMYQVLERSYALDVWGGRQVIDVVNDIRKALKMINNIQNPASVVDYDTTGLGDANLWYGGR